VFLLKKTLMLTAKIYEANLKKNEKQKNDSPQAIV
jgi:hypothetical protein